MWILLLIILSGPHKVERVDLLKITYGKQECLSEVKRALSLGMPRNSSISCVPLAGVLQVEKRQ